MDNFRYTPRSAKLLYRKIFDSILTCKYIYYMYIHNKCNMYTCTHVEHTYMQLQIDAQYYYL